MSDMFPIRNGLKQGEVLSPLLFTFSFENAIRRDKVKQDGLQLNCTYKLLIYADNFNTFGRKSTYFEGKHGLLDSV